MILSIACTHTHVHTQTRARRAVHTYLHTHIHTHALIHQKVSKTREKSTWSESNILGTLQEAQFEGSVLFPSLEAEQAEAELSPEHSTLSLDSHPFSLPCCVRQWSVFWISVQLPIFWHLVRGGFKVTPTPQHSAKSKYLLEKLKVKIGAQPWPNLAKTQTNLSGAQACLLYEVYSMASYFKTTSRSLDMPLSSVILQCVWTLIYTVYVANILNYMSLTT